METPKSMIDKLEKLTEMLDWLRELTRFAKGKKWNTGEIWVCESHSLMPAGGQGTSFDCKCGGDVGMPPFRTNLIKEEK